MSNIVNVAEKGQQNNSGSGNTNYQTINNNLELCNRKTRSLLLEIIIYILNEERLSTLNKEKSKSIDFYSKLKFNNIDDNNLIALLENSYTFHSDIREYSENNVSGNILPVESLKNYIFSKYVSIKIESGENNSNKLLILFHKNLTKEINSALNLNYYEKEEMMDSDLDQAIWGIISYSFKSCFIFDKPKK